MRRDRYALDPTSRVDELVAIGRQLEELERPKARERQVVGLRQGDSSPLGSPDPNGEPARRTSEIVGEALGMSRRTYERAKDVIDAIGIGHQDHSQ